MCHGQSGLQKHHLHFGARYLHIPRYGPLDQSTGSFWPITVRDDDRHNPNDHFQLPGRTHFNPGRDRIRNDFSIWNWGRQNDYCVELYGKGGYPLIADCRIRIANCGGNKGFTLIEIIILIVTAGILLPALIVPFITGVRGSGKPEMVTKAMYLGHQRMEEFMKFNYSGVALTALTAYVDADPVNLPNYQWQWEVTYVDDNFNSLGSDAGYKKILVRVKDPENSPYEIYSVVTDFP